MDSHDLIANLAATNNGYLFAPTAVELATARANPELFDVTAAGTIKTKGFVIPLYSIPAKVSHARNYDLDFDYEGAIIARQSYQYI